MVEKAKIKDKIIEAAKQIFAKFGYKKTTIDDIAQKVKKGKSSIYYYFPSKEAIFKAVVLKEGKTFRKTILTAVESCEDPREKLQQYVVTRMNTVNKFTNFHATITSDALNGLNFVKKLKKIYDKEEIRLFRRILKQGVEANYFQITDIELAAIAIVMAMKGMESTLFLSQHKPDFEQKLRDIIYIIFYGIVKR